MDQPVTTDTDKLQLFWSLMNQASDAIHVADEAGTLLFANEQACLRLGKTRDQLLGQHVGELEHLFKVPGVWEEHVHDLKQLGRQQVVGSHVGPQGQSIPVEVSLAYVEVGGQGYVVATSRNITECNTLDRHLMLKRMRMERLTAISISGHAAILSLDLGATLRYHNQAAEPLVEYFFGLQIHPLPAHIEFFRKLLEATEVLETELEGPEGCIYRYVVVPYQAEGYVDIYVQDFTQYYNDQERLRLLSLVASKTDNGVVITDAKGNIEWVNDGFERITGYLLEEMRGKRPGEVLQGPGTRAEDITAFAEGLASGQPFTVEILNYSKTGMPYWVSCNVTPIYDRHGMLDKFIAIESDITAQRMGSESLKEINFRFSTLLAYLQHAILVEDEYRNVAIVNQQFCEMFRLPVSPELLIGTNCEGAELSVMHLHQDPQLFVEKVQKLVADGKPVLNEEIEMADGRVLARDFVPIVEDGEQLGIVWSYQEITSRKLDERRLAHNLRQQLLLAELSYDLSRVDTPFDDKINLVLAKLGEFIQVSRVYIFEDDASGQTTSNTFEWCNHGILVEIDNMQDIPYSMILSFLEILERDQIVNSRTADMQQDIRSILEKQGILSVLVYPLICEGVRVGFVGFDDCLREHIWESSDLALLRTVANMISNEYERKRNVERLAHNLRQQLLLAELSYDLSRMDMSFEEKIQLVFSKLGDFTQVSRVYIFEDDAQGITTSNTFEWCNHGIAPEIENLQEVPYEMIPSFPQLLQRDHIINSKTEGLPEDVRQIVESQGVLSILIYPINSEGRRIGFMGLDDCVHAHLWESSDIALLRTVSAMVSNEYERKRNMERLESARRQALEAARAKEIFLANMSHEIRTPMNAIMGMSNLLHNTDLTAKQYTYVHAIKTSADNLLVLLNDILDLTKIDAGQLQLERIPFSLKEVISQVVRTQSFRANQKGLLLRKEYDSRIAQGLLGDPFRLTQVLLNLISNAIKFTEEGSVTLSCMLLEETDTHQIVELSVQDTGIGIEPNRLDVVFENFQQSDASIARKYGGTGLGLSITRKIVDLFGGRVTVESQLGQGTIFRVQLSLPFVQDQQIPEKEVKEISADALKGLHVLLAEDHEFNRILAISILENWGVKIDVAMNGMEAVQHCRQHVYDVILMDIQMPEMDGIAATRVIRKELGLHTPIVALTANAFKEDRNRYLAEGMNGYVSKPFEPEQLFDTIWQVIEQDTQVQQRIQQERSVPMSVPLRPVEEKLYDLTKLQKMAGGNDAFVQRMVNVFIENTSSLLLKISDHMERHEYEKVGGIMHQLKPSVDMMGMVSVLEHVREAEAMGKSGRVPKSEFKGLVSRVIERLRTGVEQLKAR